MRERPHAASRAWVALSGGVDSAVAAALAIERGLDVVGVTMVLGVDAGIDNAVVEAASRVAHTLGIQHRVIDLGEPFETQVVQPFIAEYLAGNTPNPCVVCNDVVKAGLLLEAALADGADTLVTGHYAGIVQEKDSATLHRGTDARKDQSYFLYRLVGDRLRHLSFPLGDLNKSQVRALAHERGLPSAGRDESQDVCFLGGGGVESFLQARGAVEEPGEIVDIEGRALGTHDGISHFTVGQRKGIGVGGGPPLYVVRIDAETNRVVVGSAEASSVATVRARDIVWDSTETELRVQVQVRYRTPPVDATARFAADRLVVELDSPVTGVAPGQSLVCYVGDRVVGGGFLTGES